MRIRKFKKIAAAVLAAVVAVTSIPLTGVNAAITEPTSTVNFDLSGFELAPKDDGTGYKDLELEETTLFGDVPVLATSSKKVKVQASTNVSNENGVVFDKRLSLGGTGNTEYRAIKLILPTTSKVTVWALSGGASERTLNVSNGTEVITTIPALSNTNSTVNGQSITLKAGTYYIFSKSSGINVFDVDIQWAMDFDISGFELTPKADGSGYEDLSLTENKVAGDFELLATSAKAVKIQASSNVANEDGVAFTKRLSLGGTGNTGYRAVKFTLPHSAEVTVWALSGGASERTLNVSDGTNVITTIPALSNTNSTVNGQTVTLKAGTYYIYSKSSGINIFDIKAKYAPIFDISGFELTPKADGSGYEDLSITENKAAGDFELLATSAKAVKIQAATNVVNDTGKAFDRRLSLGGTGNTGYRAVKFTLAYRTSLDVYALSGGSSERVLNVSDGSKVLTTLKALSNTNSTVQPSSLTLAPGTYYIYSNGSGINIFDIKVKPDKTTCDWSEVEAPVINSVTVNEDNGNFVVNFKGLVDKYEGAEYIMISMVSNGAEVSSYKVIGKEQSVEMTPYWDGDYSFTITAMRSGEAHKTGNTVEVKDFKLRLKAPIFRMFESIGGGKVYVDWVDNEFADVYEVYYKLASESDDKYVAVTKELKEGNIALSGLKVGETYTVKVVAKNSESGLSSAYASDVLITDKAADKQWFVASTGSNQTVKMTITTADGTVETHVISVMDQSKDKTAVKDAVNVTNTTGKIEIAAASDGKISDDEDGFRYYYTMINPNTENFKLTATFKITDTSLTPDNQTGFGIIASDIIGQNWFGDGSYVHKYHNSVLMGHYSATKNPNGVFKYVTGYNSGDASNADTAERVNTLKKFAGKVEYVVGNTYTFTLEKTNDKFIGTFNGDTIELADTSILSVQEDGSICIGVFSARKVGVEITDIKFSTSESTGVTGGVKADKVTPSTRIYSTGTVGDKNYELIYASNVAGVLKVIGPDGKVYDSVTMKADSVARVNVTLKDGKNTVKTVFTPDKNAELTSYADIEKSVDVTCKQIGSAGGAIYVSPDGKDDAKGTKEEPMSLTEAVKYARPGQVIVMLDGEYTKAVKIPRSVSGTADKMITLMAENTGKAVFNGAGLEIEGSYWHVYGVNTVKAPGVGIQIYGNYNTVEMCVVQGSGNSGIQISRSGGATNKQGIEGLLWPSYNLVKNCESFDNCDKGMNDADGFAAKLTCGEGNKFYGCSSHNNIDDGWDLFAKTVSGEIGSVIIENCIAYDNGVLSDGSAVTSGEGNGFKLGGGYLKGGHVLKNSIAFNNIGKGITSNSCPDVEIYNCTSYNNQATGGNGYNVGLNTKASAEKPWKVDGLLSMNVPKNTTTADLFPFALQSKTNFIYDGNVSFNTEGVVAEDSWFVSVDVSKKPTRNANGTINMAGLLELKEETLKAHAGVGAVLDVTSDAAISVAPSIPTDVSPDTGDNSNAMALFIVMMASAAVFAGAMLVEKKRSL